jgi:hypothetical protein
VGNPRAKAALVLGVLAALYLPLGLAAARYTTVSLFQATYAFPVGVLLGVVATVQARRAREVLDRTIGRAGGERQAAWGRRLGLLGVCISLTVGLALGFYWILVAFSH